MGRHEAMIAAGIGCRRGCPEAAIVAVVEAAFARHGRRADTLAAPAFKAGEVGLRAAVVALALPLRLVEDAALAAAQARCATRSAAVARHVGVASVAEAAALAAAGPRARLVLARIVVAGATCALAEAP